MDRSAALAAESPRVRSRAHRALRARHNWLQLLKFCVVGGSGYVINLAVFAGLVKGADVHYTPDRKSVV